MGKLQDTFRNIFKIHELRQRILYTLALLFIVRLGSHITLPGIDSSILAEAMANRTSDNLFGLYDLFAGGAFSNAAIFALGIMPYISASIIIQLGTAVVPYFQKLQREGEEGRKKMTQLTRYGTVLISLFQAWGIVTLHLPGINLNGLPIIPVEVQGFGFTLSSVSLLIAGTMFMMWMGEQITEKGIGNGISLIIFINIINRLPFALLDEYRLVAAGTRNIVLEVVVLTLMVFIIAGIVLVTQGTRRIPVQYAKRVVGRKVYGGVTQYIPLRVNTAGVMPIIFAQSIMFIPNTVLSFFPDSEFMQSMAGYFNYQSYTYAAIYAVIIIFFTYFYTAIAFNPQDVAENMKKQGGFVPGIRPGKQTSEFIDNILTRITLPGSIFLAIIAILPTFIAKFGVSGSFAAFFGGTSLLIIVGVALDTLQQIESHLLMRHYDGFMKSGKMRAAAAECSLILIKTKKEIEFIKESCQIVAETLQLVKRNVAPGVTTIELDKIAEDYIRSNNAIPAFKGYSQSGCFDFPGTICSSVNEEVVHGIPADRVLKEGDIISVDVGVIKNKYFGDAALTVAVGEIDPKVKKLMDVTERSLYLGIEQAVIGNRIGDISFAIQQHVEENGFSIVRDLCGHGVGKYLHEDPQIPNFGRKNTGPVLKEGMTIALEPMVNLGKYRVEVAPDGWTVYAADRLPSAHYEHTIAITNGKPEILSVI